jgi:hypothetical protein
MDRSRPRLRFLNQTDPLPKHLDCDDPMPITSQYALMMNASNLSRAETSSNAAEALSCVVAPTYSTIMNNSSFCKSGFPSGAVEGADGFAIDGCTDWPLQYQ